ncbi:MAG: undecaprenyl-phosphate glucose phosphotransferase [Lachnospiraceae bacterium]|nr:undecaprenyl-phosphate glucose phosphotransferase [Lachnospiraceae bacterium]
MIKRNQSFLNFINIFLDAILIFVSYYLSVFVRFRIMDGKESLELRDGKWIFVILIYDLIVILTYYISHLYHSQRIHTYGKVFFTIYVSNGLGVLLLSTYLYLDHVTNYSRILLAIFWVTASTVVFVKHVAVHSILHYYRSRGYNLKHVAIVGNGHLAMQYVQDINANPQFGFAIDGYVSAVDKEGLGKRLGRYEELEQILDRHPVDELIVALEPHETQFMKFVIDVADKQGIRVNLIPFYNDYYPTHAEIESVGNTKLINLRATPLDNVGWAIVKRGADVIGSLALLILTSPIMLFVAIGVKVTSPGPILFKQERVGKNKKTFQMLKFRSMRIDVDHSGWTTDKDERKTKFGSFIRKCSLDELPQLWNVLVGEMSLIGPRPELPLYVSQFKEDIPLYLVRQQVRPGMTGWAQVNGLRGDTSIEERVKYDIWYIENWSIGLDIKIVIKTIFGGMINNEKL